MLNLILVPLANYSISQQQPRKHLKVKVVDNVCVVTLDSPDVKVNSINREVLREFGEVVSAIENDPNTNAVVLISGMLVHCLVIICLVPNGNVYYREKR